MKQLESNINVVLPSEAMAIPQSEIPWQDQMTEALTALRRQNYRHAILLFITALNSQDVACLSLIQQHIALYMTDTEFLCAVSDVLREPVVRSGKDRAGFLLFESWWTNMVSNQHHENDSIKTDSGTPTDCDALQHLTPNSDVFSLLPLDVTELIVGMLSMADRAQCAAVSKAWRSFILGCPSTWREIHLGTHRHISNFSSNYRKEKEWYDKYMLGQFVRHVIFVDAGVEGIPQDFIRLLIDHNCCNIKTLDLRHYKASVDLFKQLIFFLGDRLEQLILAESLSIPVDVVFNPAVLKSMSNLRRLEYNWGGNEHWYVHPTPVWTLPPIVPNEPYPLQLPITQLSVHIEYVHGHIPIESMLACCPRLRRLSISTSKQCDINILLQAVYRWCPDIEICLVGWSRPLKDKIRLRDADDPGHGLRLLRLARVEGIRDDVLLPLIERNHHSLEYLSLAFWSGTLSKTWARLSQIKAENLREIWINQPCRMTLRVCDFDALLRGAPNLETLNLVKVQFDGPLPSQTLGQLRYLTNVNMSDCDILTRTQDDDGGLADYFLRAVSLKRVLLDSLDFLTDMSLKALCQQKSLQVVHILSCENVTNAGIHAVANGSHNIQSLRVEGCRRVTTNTIGYLRNRIPLTPLTIG